MIFCYIRIGHHNLCCFILSGHIQNHARILGELRVPACSLNFLLQLPQLSSHMTIKFCIQTALASLLHAHKFNPYSHFSIIYLLPLRSRGCRCKDTHMFKHDLYIVSSYNGRSWQFTRFPKSPEYFSSNKAKSFPCLAQTFNFFFSINI